LLVIARIMARLSRPYDHWRRIQSVLPFGKPFSVEQRSNAMQIDLPTVADIVTIGNWLWHSYGKPAMSKMAKGVAGKRDERLRRKQWEQATAEYMGKLQDQIRFVGILGKTGGRKALDQIYTDVHLLDEVSANRRYGLEGLEVEFASRQPRRQEDSKRLKGEAIVAREDRLFILGKPGAGKTTFLKQVAWRTIIRNRQDDQAKKLPIFVTLKELSDSGLALVPFIEDQFERAGFPNAGAFVEQLLKAGDAIILLDGLAEVSQVEEQQADLIKAINQFVFAFHRCQLLLTCRLAASNYQFKGFSYVEMADFSPEQQKTFIYRWFEKRQDKEACWQALQDSKNATLQELARIPLLLSLLCVLFEVRPEKDFPKERHKIYWEATQALLGNWDEQDKSIQRGSIYETLTPVRKEALLAEIAAQTFERQEYFIPQQRLVSLIEVYLRRERIIQQQDGIFVLREMEAQHGLLVERARNIYSFSHLTLQEYFTAHYIVANESRGSLPRLMTHVGDYRWREVFLLTAAMLDDATDFAYYYLAALERLAANDQRLLAILRWNAAQNSSGSSDIPLPAVRAIGLLFLAAFFRRRYPFTLGYIAQAIQRIASILGHDILGTEQKMDVEYADLFLLIVELVLTLDPDLATEIPKSASESLDWLYLLNQRFGLPWKEQTLERHVFYAEEMSDKGDVLWRIFTEYLDFKIDEDIRYTGRCLTQYLNANLGLLECLEVAYVPERQAIVDRLLLPPG
jgi:predicted NACHT family NTPase